MALPSLWPHGAATYGNRPETQTADRWSVRLWPCRQKAQHAATRGKTARHSLAGIEEDQREQRYHEQNVRHQRVYWLRMGEPWLAIKSDPVLDDIGGIEAIRPLLRRSPQYLNRCAIAYDGSRTGDLERGEIWCRHTNYPLMHEYEPYLMAEIVEAYAARRSRPRPRVSRTLAATAGDFFAKSDRVIAGLGSVMHGDCHPLFAEIPDGVIDFVFADPTYGVDGLPGDRKKQSMNGIAALSDRLWPEIWRVLRPGGTVAILRDAAATELVMRSWSTSFMSSTGYGKQPTSIRCGGGHSKSSEKSRFFPAQAGRSGHTIHGSRGDD